MKLALLATLVTFGGSLAGFGLASGGSSAPAVSAGPADVRSEEVIVRGRDRDCPKAETAKRT